MLSRDVILDEAGWQERRGQGSQAKRDSAHQPATLREQVYQLETTDRELLYGDSLLSEWVRLSNCSPDDFE